MRIKRQRSNKLTATIAELLAAKDSKQFASDYVQCLNLVNTRKMNSSQLRVVVKSYASLLQRHIDRVAITA